jgi:hypothetical protein
MHMRHKEAVELALPLVSEDCGGSIWLRKL